MIDFYHLVFHSLIVLCLLPFFRAHIMQTGSIAGACESADPVVKSVLGRYNGMAPRAKLSFYDLKKASSSQLMLPDNLYDDLWMHSYTKTGSRIGSMSWGSEDGFYDQYSYDTDRFVYKYPGTV